MIDRADRLAGKATLTNGLFLGRSEVLRSLKHYLRAQSQGHHTIDGLDERGVERGSLRRPSSKEQRESLEPFQGDVGKTYERRCGALMGFSECIDTIVN